MKEHDEDFAPFLSPTMTNDLVDLVLSHCSFVGILQGKGICDVLQSFASLGEA